MAHKLTIVSLENPAQIECECGMKQTTYGASMTRAEAKKEFEKHCYVDFKIDWEKSHSISRAPSFSSWKTNYRNV